MNKEEIQNIMIDQLNKQYLMYLMNMPQINQMSILSSLGAQEMLPMNQEIEEIQPIKTMTKNKQKTRINKIFKIHKHSFIQKKRPNMIEEKYYMLNLNNISVNYHSLELFPYVDLDSELLSVKIRKEYIYEKKVKIVNIRKDLYICSDYPKYIKSELLFSNESNSFKRQVDTVEIIKYFYKDFKKIIRNMNNCIKYKNDDYKSEYYLLKLIIHIKNFNYFIDLVQKIKIISNSQFNLANFLNNISINTQISNIQPNFTCIEESAIKQKKPLFIVMDEKPKKTVKDGPNNEKIYKCDFCSKVFSNGPSLGGHTRQCHPNQSVKYREKMIIRKKRTFFRNYIEKVKLNLFNNHGLDYLDLVKRGEKVAIKKFIKDNFKEYLQLKKSIKFTSLIN